MTAEPPQSPVTEGVRSLEVRWIFPGQPERAVAYPRAPVRRGAGSERQPRPTGRCRRPHQITASVPSSRTTRTPNSAMPAVLPLAAQE
jgi:hypothetical protein